MSLSSFLGLRTEVVGLDIGQHSVRVAQLKRPRQHSRLVSLGIAELPKKTLEKGTIANPDALIETIKSALQNATPHRITAKTLVAALPEIYIFSKVIQMPNLPPNELQKAIPFETSQFIPMPIDEMYIDYTPLALHPDKQQIDVAIFAAPKQMVDSLIDITNQAGFELSALETKSTAITRSLLPAGSTDAIQIIEIGSESTRMTISDHGNVWLTTSLNIGEAQLLKTIGEKLNQPENEVRDYLSNHKSSSIDSVVSSAVAPIVQEAVSANRFHETRDYQADKIKRAILVGQGSTIPGIIPAVVGSMHIQCEPGLPLVTGTTEVNLQYAVSLGLSMRPY